MADKMFRFGLHSNPTGTRADLMDKARQAEDLGFDTLLLGDHVFIPMTPFQALALAATVTTTLRFSTCVLCNDFYNPVNLARDASTLDIISEGRFELGLGTGWFVGDYQATGIPLESPGTRVSRLQESIQILNQAFSGEEFSFEGKFFKVENFQLAGLPIQKPRPPLMLGGGGKRMLSFAAREADIISFNPISTREGGIDATTSTVKSTTEKAAWVKGAAGSQRDPELSTHFMQLQITNTRAERDAAVDSLLRNWELTEAMTPEDLLESPHYLIGSENELIEKLLRLREQFGITYFVFRGPMQISAQLIKRLKT